MDMSAVKSDSSKNMETIGSSAECVVIDSAAIMSIFREAQGAVPASSSKSAQRRRVREGAKLHDARRRVRSAMQCACGSCHTCRENEKWNRIFQEKFADPDYYAKRSVTFRSPIHMILS